MKSLSTTAPRAHGVGTPQVAVGGACPLEILPSSVDNYEEAWLWTTFPDLQKSPENRNGSIPYAQDHLPGLSAQKDGIPGSLAEIAGNSRLGSGPDPGPRSGVELRPISRRTSHAPPMRLRFVGYTSNLAGGPGVLYEPGHNFGAISDPLRTRLPDNVGRVAPARRRWPDRPGSLGISRHTCGLCPRRGWGR